MGWPTARMESWLAFESRKRSKPGKNSLVPLFWPVYGRACEDAGVPALPDASAAVGKRVYWLRGRDRARAYSPRAVAGRFGVCRSRGSHRGGRSARV